jgi:hypothetical protein
MNKPKEKAQELYSKMYGESPIRSVILEIEKDKIVAKNCAIIAVKVIICELEKLHKPEYTTFITREPIFLDGGLSEEGETCDGYELIEYYKEVKEELIKLKV